MLPEDPMIAKVHGAIMMGAGATFALGILPKTSARILALTLIPNTFIGHPFWKSSRSPRIGAPSLCTSSRTLGLFGGLLYVSADKRTAARAGGLTQRHLSGVEAREVARSPSCQSGSGGSPSSRHARLSSTEYAGRAVGKSGIPQS